MARNGDYPDTGTLPSVIPIFPLPGVLLLPGGQLPLNIFEPRYVAMTIDALGAGRLIGMIQPSPVAGVATADPDLRASPDIYGVGCVGRIVSFSETGDGRLLITLLGQSRFRVRSELPLVNGYRRVQADYSEFAHDLTGGASDGSPAPQIDRRRLVKAAKGYFDAQGLEADWPGIDAAPDDLLLTSLAMVCPLDSRDKQALLECADTGARAELLIELLEMAVHGNAVGLDGAAH